MDEDELNKSLIIDDFTPLTHALERLKEKEDADKDESN